MAGFLGRSWHILLAVAGVALVVPATIGVVHYLHSSTALSSAPMETTDMAGAISPSTVADASTTTDPGDATPPDVNASISPAAGAIAQKLTTHGRWLHNTHYGKVWAPQGVSSDWQPYTVGHWSYSDDDGWYWNSDEAWSDTYHYGRWYNDSSEGWVWVPGTEWAPSWVAWRQPDANEADGGYYGWAPLPPEGNAYAAQPIFEQPIVWAFVAARFINSPHIHQVIIPRDRNVTIIRQTQIINNIRIVDRRGINRGIDPRRIEQVTHRQIPVHSGKPADPLPQGIFHGRNQPGNANQPRPEQGQPEQGRPGQGQGLWGRPNQNDHGNARGAGQAGQANATPAPAAQANRFHPLAPDHTATQGQPHVRPGQAQSTPDHGQPAGFQGQPTHGGGNNRPHGQGHGNHAPGTPAAAPDAQPPAAHAPAQPSAQPHEHPQRESGRAGQPDQAPRPAPVPHEQPQPHEQAQPPMPRAQPMPHPAVPHEGPGAQNPEANHGGGHGGGRPPQPAAPHPAPAPQAQPGEHPGGHDQGGGGAPGGGGEHRDR